MTQIKTHALVNKQFLKEMHERIDELEKHRDWLAATVLEVTEAVVGLRHNWDNPFSDTSDTSEDISGIEGILKRRLLIPERKPCPQKQ